MKLICYILLILLIPAIPVGAQTLSGGQVQVSNQSILISDNGPVSYTHLDVYKRQAVHRKAPDRRKLLRIVFP